MTAKTTFNREALSRTLALVRPALAGKDYIPALTHILFDGGRATAYNDVAAISVRSDLDLGRCVPGAKLVAALGSFGGAEVLVQSGKDSEVIVKSGRGSVRLATLPADDFPYEAPGKGLAELNVERELVSAVERCLMGVGAESGHPAQGGVTLDEEGGLAVLYSTDGFTMSRCLTGTKVKLPGGAPVILPRFFCEQLVGLSKAFPEEELFLVIHDGALQADVGEAATLFTRVPVDVEPIDFPRKFARHCPLGDLAKELFAVPDALDSALQRSLLVLADEKIKTARVTLADNTLSLRSGSGSQSAEDDMKYDGDKSDPKGELRVDPSLLARGAKVCAIMGFTNDVTVMASADGRFAHLIGHVAR